MIRRLIAAGSAVVLLALCLAPAALAVRSATRAESRAMWKTVDPESKCVHRKGKISTVPTAAKWGKVTISDNQCGNGSYVLRKRPGKAWKTVAAGSDWGAPESCASNQVPLRVLRDFFGQRLCRS